MGRSKRYTKDFKQDQLDSERENKALERLANESGFESKQLRKSRRKSKRIRIQNPTKEI